MKVYKFFSLQKFNIKLKDKLMTPKNIFSIAFSAFMAVAFYAIPSYAQTAQQKASEINAADKSAVQSQSATEAKDINNAAWDGAKQGSGSSIDGKTIDIIGGYAPVSEKNEETSFDEPKSEDVTPWKTELISIISTFSAAMIALFIATILIHQGISTPLRAKIGMTIAFAAVAACTAALGLAITIMIKYKQYALGGMWAGVCGAGIASCLVAAFAGINQYKVVALHLKSFLAKHIAAIGLTLFGICSAGAGVAYYFTPQMENRPQQQEQDCTQNPDSSECQKQADR